jgi:hypothetical protein
MARMGHDNERAALRYQHRSSNADRTNAGGLDALVDAEQDQDEGSKGRPDCWCQWPKLPVGGFRP